MEKEQIQQVQRLTESILHIQEKRVQDAKIDIAIILNEMQEKSKQFAEPSGYADGYKDAIQEIKDKAGFTNTIYELYKTNPT